MPRPAASDAAGQASVELVALLPLVAAVLALGWQAVLAGHASWAATAAARAAARAAAIGGDPSIAARTRLPESLERGLRVSRVSAGTVEVSLRVPPIVAALPLGRVHARCHFRPQEPAS
jgi:hypothetical protein